MWYYFYPSSSFIYFFFPFPLASYNLATFMFILFLVLQDVEGNSKSMDGSLQYGPHQSSSQMQRQPITACENMENHPSERCNNLIHLGKRNRTTTRVGQVNLPTGYGCYVNENTGHTILNVSLIPYCLVL